MMKEKLLYGVLAVAFGVMAWGLLSIGRPTKEPVINKPAKSREATAATDARVDGQVSLNAGMPETAREELEAVLVDFGDSEDIQTQDEVSSARLSLGFVAAQRGDFTEARELFLEAAEKHVGSNAKNPEFGSLIDQALYQAAVCLQAEDRTGEAIEESKQFLIKRQESPLVFTVHKRLKTLVSTTEMLEIDSLLQDAVAAQEIAYKRDVALCGPRAVRYVLTILGLAAPTVDELAEECETTAGGTTMASVADALANHDLPVQGKRLNWRDFKTMNLPAIWLRQDHYVVVTEVKRQSVTIYDPLYKTEQSVQIERENENKFVANVLVPIR